MKSTSGALLGLVFLLVSAAMVSAAESFLPSSVKLELPSTPPPRNANWSVGFIDRDRPVSQTFRALQIWIIPSNYSQDQIHQASVGVTNLGNLSVANPPWYQGEDDGNSTRGFLYDILDRSKRGCVPKSESETSGETKSSWTFDTAQYPNADSFTVHIAEMFWTNSVKGVEEFKENGQNLLCIEPQISNYSIKAVTVVNTSAPTTTRPDSELPITTTQLAFSTATNAYGEPQPSYLPAALEGGKPSSAASSFLVLSTGSALCLATVMIVASFSIIL